MTQTPRRSAFKAGRKYLLVASTGGHLAQLVRFAGMQDLSAECLWVTFKTPQSESLLEGRRVMYVPYVRSRDLWGALHAARRILPAVRGESFDGVVSTGAALAFAAFIAAFRARIPRTYIESVSRTDGPSFTGRLVARLHLADLWTQHPAWATPRWKPHVSVLSAFRSVDKVTPSATDSVSELKLFVTLGTIKPYRFDRLVDAITKGGLAGDQTVWQLGDTAREGLPGTSSSQMSADDFRRHSREADVVITHAGVGTILGLLEDGIYPVVVPRRSSLGEHVDDHQSQITKLVDELGVAVAVDADDLSAGSLISAAQHGVVPA